MCCHGMHRKIRINWRIGRNLRVAARVVRVSCMSLRGDLVTRPVVQKERSQAETSMCSPSIRYYADIFARFVAVTEHAD